MELNIDPNWLIRMAEKEDNGIVSVGGLATRIDQRIAGDKANMNNKYIVRWEAANGREGHAQPVDEEIAKACAAEMNEKYPDIHHWVVPADSVEDAQP